MSKQPLPFRQSDGHKGTFGRLFALAGAMGSDKALADVVRRASTPRNGTFEAWQLTAVAGILDALARGGRSLDTVAGPDARAGVRRAIERARSLAADAKAPLDVRAASVGLLLRDTKHQFADLKIIAGLMTHRAPPALQAAVVRP